MAERAAVNGRAEIYEKGDISHDTTGDIAAMD